MTPHKYTIELTSDAEPGTGLGGQVVNDYAPRDHLGRWTIPASHIKGLIRQTLEDAVERLQQTAGSWWSQRLVERALGAPDQRRPGVEAAFRLTGAVARSVQSQPKYITRTAVDPNTGGASGMSLRTTETIPAGTRFEGTVYSSVAPDSVEDLAWRFGLLGIGALGGGRTRGCGACVIRLEQSGGKMEKRTPGQLLKALHEAMKEESERPERAGAEAPTDRVSPVQLSPTLVTLRLTFEARTPLCCPEIPDKTNVIRSGFSIPASAVQGVILNRINSANPAVADQLFLSPSFRAWPMQPVRLPKQSGDDPSRPLSATRVSLTHQAAKFSVSESLGPGDFRDAAIEPYRLQGALGEVPLKASDGVLLRYDDGSVRLWKAGDMPHVVTSHGVHNDPRTPGGRNLYTVDSIAPMIFEGLVVLPENAAAILDASLRRSPVQAIGKSRTVRGIGELSLTRLDKTPPEWSTPADQSHTVLVVQSPLLLPDSLPDRSSSEEELADLAKEWANRHGLPAPSHPKMRPDSDEPERATWANIGIRFGWNRHASDKNSSGRLWACRVVLPGSVIVFPSRVDDDQLATAIRAGIGEGRERGFGAVHVHPGRAVGLYEPTRAARNLVHKVPKFPKAAKLAVEIHKSAPRLPSPSQIRALQQCLEASGSEAAKAFLGSQLERTNRIWATWEGITEKVHELLGLPGASRGLIVLANLAAADDKEARR